MFVRAIAGRGLSEDNANACFAEGVQDEILTRLAKVADLKGISVAWRIRCARRVIFPDNFIGKFWALNDALAYGRADDARAALAEIGRSGRRSKQRPISNAGSRPRPNTKISPAIFE